MHPERTQESPQSPLLTGKAPVKGGKKSISDLEKADQQAATFPSLEEGGCKDSTGNISQTEREIPSSPPF